jgi:ubiquinone/menaquinone biosynthesis C-methylase UbiE
VRMTSPKPAPPKPTPPSPSARVAALFDRVAHTYESVGVPWFVPIAEGLVAAVAPQPGEHALDLGCGRGAALVPLATAVGPDGRVLGADLSSRMVELAAQRVEELGLTNVELSVMDVSAPTLPAGQADVVVASLVVFFLPKPAEALAAWTALLRPGGRLGISTFAGRDDAWRRLDDLFTPYLPPMMLDARTSGESWPFANDANVEALFRGAGLVEVTTGHADVVVRFADVDAWVTWSQSHGQRAMWDQVPAHVDAGLRAQAAEILDGARDGDGDAALTQQVRYTLGRAAA